MLETRLLKHSRVHTRGADNPGMSMMDEVVCNYVCKGFVVVVCECVCVCVSLPCGMSPWISVTVQWSVSENKGQDPFD